MVWSRTKPDPWSPQMLSGHGQKRASLFGWLSLKGNPSPEKGKKGAMQPLQEPGRVKSEFKRPGSNPPTSKYPFFSGRRPQGISLQGSFHFRIFPGYRKIKRDPYIIHLNIATCKWWCPFIFLEKAMFQMVQMYPLRSPDQD